MRDSLKFTGLYPADAIIAIARDSVSSSLVSAQSGREMSVQPCAMVKFKNDSPDAIDIVFDDSTKTGQCAGWEGTGNISAIFPGGQEFRTFPAVGTIKWSARNPQNGQLYPGVTGSVRMRTP
jgi:hypothetical protein